MDPVILLLAPLLLGALIDLCLGDPVRLPHPIVGYGRLIACGEAWLNSGGARVLKGALLTVVLVVGTALGWWLLLRGTQSLSPWFGLAWATLGVWWALAHRGLIDEGRAVFAAVEEDLDKGRRQLARIVGRDTGELSAAQVRTGAAESMAENLCDGVVAPLFYFGIGGVPAMMTYKMSNTLDSMIGYRGARYAKFGRVAARWDDVLNYVPARLTAGLMILAGGGARAWRSVRRYGRAHASPNAGYPEAALAGLLGTRFGGPHHYHGERIDKPWIGDGTRELTPADCATIVNLNHRVAGLMLGLAALLRWMLAV